MHFLPSGDAPMSSSERLQGPELVSRCVRVSKLCRRPSLLGLAYDCDSHTSSTPLRHTSSTLCRGRHNRHTELPAELPLPRVHDDDTQIAFGVKASGAASGS